MEAPERVEAVKVGTKVWVRRGGGAPKGAPGCTRRVRGTLVGVQGHERFVRLDEDDPLDTVGWKKAGEVGHWCSSSVRTRTEQKENDMEPHDFGWAIRALKQGLRVTRPSWNGKGMYLFLGKVASFSLEAQSLEQVQRAMEQAENFTQDSIRPCVFMRDAQGKLVPGWAASQTDMLAEDWMVVE